MSTVSFLLVFSVFFLAMYAATWGIQYLDATKGWQIDKWLNGETVSPIAKPDTRRDGLRERIEILEKIVTEPSYELNQKINRL